MIEEQKKPESPPEWHKVRFIVPRTSQEEFTYADVHAVVERSEQIHDNHFFSDLMQAVTAWVIKDPKGKKWWRLRTSEDANIGDLAMLCPPEGELKQELTRVGIHDLEIETFCHHDTPADWTYDSHLVDSGLVEDAEDEED